MSRYVFESADGTQIELEYPMAEAPPIGKTVRRGGTIYRRVPSRTQAPIAATPITSYTLPSKQCMHPELRQHVERWNSDDAPQFTSQAAAKRYTEAERRLCEKGELPSFHTYGDAPSVSEVRAAREAGKKIKVDK